jgi:hypothetical protein
MRNAKRRPWPPGKDFGPRKSHTWPTVERARKLMRENSCDREGDCKGGRIVGGELPEAAEQTHELIESKSEIEKGNSVPSVGVREVEES